MRLLLPVALLLLVPTAFAGSITGVFQGTVVQLPAVKPQPKGSSQAAPRWMYVQGKNGTIRRANILKALIGYDDDYPRAKRHKKAEDSLTKAATVRVTAQQDMTNDGEWQATNVVIVSPPGFVRPKSKPSSINPTLARR